MVRETARRDCTHPGTHRSSFSGQVPRGWRGAEHAGVPEGLGMQGGPAHGGGERLPRLVAEKVGTAEPSTSLRAGCRLAPPRSLAGAPAFRGGGGGARG